MTLTSRLTLGFLIITLAALGVVYIYVLPTLESRLRAEKLDAVQRSARQYGPQLRDTFQTGFSERQVFYSLSDVAAALLRQFAPGIGGGRGTQSLAQQDFARRIGPPCV